MVQRPESPRLGAGARLKIERANHHISDLNTRLTQFQAKKPFETVIRYNPVAAEASLCRKVNQPIPDEFALIIGDAVHNLRAALDLIVFELIGGKAPKPKAVQFPFTKNVQTFKATCGQRQIDVAGKHIRRVIDDLQPYPGGNDLLYGLHDLDIADKHQLLLPVASIFGLHANDMRRFGEAFAFFEGEGEVHFANFESDVLVILSGVRFDGPVPIRPFEERTEFQPPFSICFGPDQPFAARLVMPTLFSLSNEATRAVDALIVAGEADLAG